METKDLPHGIVGFNFAEALLRGEFEQAHNMLGPNLRNEYNIQGLKESFDFWIGRGHPVGLPDIEVMDNGELGNQSCDDDGWAYVAIWSEAITVTVKPIGSKYLITDLVWGRP
jgi:hypothetical protein